MYKIRSHVFIVRLGQPKSGRISMHLSWCVYILVLLAGREFLRLLFAGKTDFRHRPPELGLHHAFAIETYQACHRLSVCISYGELVRHVTQGKCTCRSAIEYVANTIVFIVSGIIIAARSYDMHQEQSPWRPDGAAYGYAVLVWVLLFVSASNQYP